LITYSGGDGRGEAGDAEAARAVFNGSGGVLWWRSGCGIGSCGSGAAQGTSFGAWLCAASFELARRRWLGLVTGAAMGKVLGGGARGSYLLAKESSTGGASSQRSPPSESKIRDAFVADLGKIP
jgi:hypothetical protein